MEASGRDRSGAGVGEDEGLEEALRARVTGGERGVKRREGRVQEGGRRPEKSGQQKKPLV